MEAISENQFSKEHIQTLAKCDISKEDLTDSIIFFKDLLIKSDLIYAEPPRKFTHSAKEVAGKLFENFVKMLGKYTLEDDTEYFLPDEEEQSHEVHCQSQESTSSTSTTSEEEYVPPEKMSRQAINRVPFDTKLKIVMTANEHPKWSFETLQKRFLRHLRHKSDIARFKKDVLKGGTYKDKLDIVKKKRLRSTYRSTK